MKSNNPRNILILTVISILLLSAVGCTQEPVNKVIRMSTTTSVNDSGLMAYLLPEF
jgi:ABC-type tungstate transport system permease subunit